MPLLVTQRDLALVVSALKQGAELNSLSEEGKSAARLALELGDSEIFKLLIQWHALVLPPLEKGRSALHEAVARHHTKLALMLLKESTLFPKIKTERDQLGRTALHLAAANTDPECVSLLLKYNCDPNVRDQDGYYPKDLVSPNAPASREIVEQLSLEDMMKRKRPPRSKSQPPDQRLYATFSVESKPRPAILRSPTPDLPKKREVVKQRTMPTEDRGTFAFLEEALKASHVPVMRGEDLQFEEMLNRGSSCVVFKGRWRGCEVAIKQFKTEYSTGLKELSKFVKEMKVLAQVRHPNLLLLMGICVDLPNLCLVTELVPNFSLFYAIHSTSYAENKAHKLTLADKFRICVQISKGLAYLHSNDPPILHRDLKPENCLLDNSLNVKIADFGLARPLTSFLVEETQDQTTTCIGTTRFMAPELFNKSVVGKIGVEVDIWALGCIMIEVFSGRRPWDYISSANANTIYYEVKAIQIFQRKPVPIPDTIPEDVTTVISLCCDYSPKRRPPAERVLSMLQEAETKLV